MTSVPADIDTREAVKLATALVAAADHNCQRLKSLPGHILGVQALTHRIQTERNVLIKGFTRPRWLKLEHILSSNLHHLGAVVQLADALSDKVDAVLKKYRDNSSNVPVFVDVVANGGLLWMKVVCRCPNTLQLAHCTGGRAGERAPLHQVKALLSLASQHPILYSTPKVAVIFCKGVSKTVFEALRREGIIVCTPFILPDSALPASIYLPEDDDDELTLTSDDSIDSKLEAALANSENIGTPSVGSDFVLYGDSNGGGKLAEENCDDGSDLITDFCHSTFQNRNFGKGDHTNTSVFKNLNNEYLENLKRRKMLGFCNAYTDDDYSDNNALCESKENSSGNPCIGRQEVETIIDNKKELNKKELNKNEDNCNFYEEGIVLRSADDSRPDLYDTSGKKQWHLCSNDEIIEIAQALRDYADKSDWARKAKKSQTFVSLCQNSHYIGSQYGASDFNTDVSNYQENETASNCTLIDPSKECSKNDFVTQVHEAESLKSHELDLENYSCTAPLLQEVDGTSCETLLPNLQTNSNVNESDRLRNDSTNITAATTGLSDAFVCKNHPLKSTENLIPSDVGRLSKLPTKTSTGHIVQTATLNVSKPSQLRGTLRLVEGLQADAARRRVCLDVPTMIAYIANTSNGFSHCRFKDGFLRQQALWEQEEPIKPVIEKYWQDCEVLVCKEALKRFESIVGVMAGKQELQRARELVSCVTVVPDHDQLKGVLQACGGITVSSRIIFGTALHHKAPLITANRRFVRSAQTQVSCVLFFFRF
ncbi:Protein of unknown function DUF1308 [Trinorchestia longiramus]|nr:Protein of unknown function DUF1308 [Trinorchestia longiramus]